jgi:hypothetical protein
VNGEDNASDKPFYIITANPSKRTALIAEMVSGALLLPGVGWIIAGNPLRGAMLLVFSLVGTWPVIVQVAGLSLGLGLVCCLPPIYVGVAFDVRALSKWIEHPKPYTWRNVLIEIGIYLGLLIALVLIDIFLIVYLVNMLLKGPGG